MLQSITCATQELLDTSQLRKTIFPLDFVFPSPMHPWILLPEQSLQQSWSRYPSPGLNEPVNSLYLWVSREWEVLHDVSQDYCLIITSLCLWPNDEHFPQCTPFLSTQHNFWESPQVSTAWNLFLWHLSSPQGWNRCPSSEDPPVLQHYHTLTWASLPISSNKPWLLQRQIASSMFLIKALGTLGHCPAWSWRSEHN